MRTLVFPVWPNRARSEDFYRVMIFPTLRAYHLYVRLRTGLAVKWRASAHCFRSRDGNCVGEVLFHRAMCGAGIVSHEMTHAAAYWLTTYRRVKPQYKPGISQLNGWDERQAYAIGRMTTQFYRAYYRLTDAVEPKVRRAA